MIQQQIASLGFQMTLNVRNKVLSAYKDTLTCQFNGKREKKMAEDIKNAEITTTPGITNQGLISNISVL